MKQTRLSSYFLFGVILIALGISGCIPTPPTPTAKPQNTPEPACPPVDFYTTNEGILGVRSTRVDKIAGDIYLAALNARAINDEAQLSRSRGQALYLLAYETWRWSSVVEKPIGDGKLRIIATFISPEFIRAITLNHVIQGNIAINGNNLSQHTHQILEGTDQRNEHLFVITVQFESPSLTAIQIDMPVKQIAIKKMDGSRTEATSPNSIFHQPINLTTGHYASIFYFPVEKRSAKGGCWAVLDTLHDKSIFLFIESLKINDQVEGEMDLSIPFVSPLGLDGDIPAVNSGTPIPMEQYGPVAAPPAIQGVQTTNETSIIPAEELKYWQDLGRFIWHNMALNQ